MLSVITHFDEAQSYSEVRHGVIGNEESRYLGNGQLYGVEFRFNGCVIMGEWAGGKGLMQCIINEFWVKKALGLFCLDPSRTLNDVAFEARKGGKSENWMTKQQKGPIVLVLHKLARMLCVIIVLWILN
ncbi:uncharacterized protein LOC111408444 [Olea europaea var. sylvestris]|uniref:uncharacterized protein LOC111408444 n=1 Tax=Olea europaea var. sylvestris TaxID=158386 RepID=UPI000C1D1588|nr:uncharacterized protein LOC111408444 [Olea europaea var. sylvestris]